MVVAEAELASASRACRSTTRRAACAGAISMPLGHRGAERGEGHEVADGHVEGAAADLQRLAVAGVDVDQLDAVGLRVGAQRQRPRRRSTPSTGAPTRSTSSTARPRRAHRVGRARRRRRSTGSRSSRSQDSSDAHRQNCSRKRMSLVNISRRSSTPWRDRAMRSVPKPKAKPLHSSGSSPTVAEHVGVHHAAPAELQPGAVGSLDVELGRRLGEREVRRPQARRVARPEVGLGEGLDGAGQVGEGDAPVDDQPLDLVEDRHVGGVGRVAPVDAAGHDDVDGRRLALHHPDLHGRRVGAQHHAAGLAVVDEQRVPLLRAGWSGRHVQGGEVVPVALDLGAFGDGEAEADEHVLEALVGLGHEVGVAARRPAASSSVRSRRSAAEPGATVVGGELGAALPRAASLELGQRLR